MRSVPCVAGWDGPKFSVVVSNMSAGSSVCAASSVWRRSSSVQSQRCFAS